MAKLIWAIAAIVSLVPFVHVLTGNDFIWSHAPKTRVSTRLAVWCFADGGAPLVAHDAAMTMTAIARSVHGGPRQAVNVNGRHVVITDEPEALGGTDLGPAPHELLAAMLASCVSTMITLYARARDWDLGELRVDVEYDPEPTPRRAEVRVHLPGNLTPDQVRRLRKVAQTCPARRALEAGFTFDEQIIVGTGALASS